MVSLDKDPAKARLAQSQVEAVLKSDPESVPALMASGSLLQEQGRSTAAQEIYERILSRNPNFAPASRRLAMLYADQVRDDTMAFEHGMKAREVFAEDAELTAVLGKIAYRRKEYARAAQLLKEAAHKRPQDADLMFHLGLAHYHLKQKSQSTEALRKALALNSNSGLTAEAKRVLEELK